MLTKRTIAGPIILDKLTAWFRIGPKWYIIGKSRNGKIEKEDDLVPIFAVIQTLADRRLEENIASHTHLKVSESAWLIAAQGTAEDVSEKLGITDGQAGSAIVLKASSYYGRTKTSTWDWIRANWE